MTDEHNNNLNNNISSGIAESVLKESDNHVKRNRDYVQTQIERTTEANIVEANFTFNASNIVSTENQEPHSFTLICNSPTFVHNIKDQQHSEDLSEAVSSGRCIVRNGAVATSKTTDTHAIIQTNPSTAFTTQPKVTTLSVVVASAKLSKKEFSLKSSDEIMATAAALGSDCTTHLVSGLKGVIDYTMNVTSSVLLNENDRGKGINSSKSEIFTSHTNGDNGNKDFERKFSSACSGQINSNFGGRLQFFKNGKVILELARSREGEKCRWISVPRKTFRSPSATSSTVTPTFATSIASAKNENSTSLSFSDDNSSIQSSPWQRDHCWKQLSPRIGISKAMSLYYQRPRSAILTKSALLIAHKKRRRPYDTTLLFSGKFLFENPDKGKGQETTSTGVKTHLQSCRLQDVAKITTDIKTESNEISKTKNGHIKSESVFDEDGCSSSSTATLTGNDSSDVRMDDRTSTPPLISTPKALSTDKEAITSTCKESTSIPIVCTEMGKLVGEEKMNTSEDEVVSTKMNGEGVKKYINDGSFREESYSGKSKKVYCGPRNRQKLNAVLQKLIDRVPVRLAKISKVIQLTGTSDVNSSLPNKVSPPNNSTATRLVEFPQQHVSPRKRILREFEKVSLEDSSNLAGGKRSRAKSNASLSTMHRNIKSPKSPSGLNAPISSGNGSIRQSSTTFSKSDNSTKSLTTTTSTRLYSSYSIHSLLGGNGDCNSSTSSTSAANKKPPDTTNVSSIDGHQPQLQTSLKQNFCDPSYLRSVLKSPKSPEQKNLSGCCKSSSTSATKNRSPPYVSPLYDLHNIIDVGSINEKARYVSEYSSSPDCTSHSHLHIQKHGLFLPYMSSKYVPSVSCSTITTTSSISPNSCGTVESRPPRNLSTFSRTSSPVTVFANIPVNQSASCSISNNRESLSPSPRPSINHQRDSTPRTLPKKTASIRRQFASSTAVPGSTGSLSPTERHSEDLYSTQDRRTPVNAGGGSHQSQCRSPSRNTVPSPLQHYYMYPPAPLNGTSSPVAHSSAISPSSVLSFGSSGTNTATAPAGASYMPSVMSPAYMNPYFALAALRHTPQIWSHYGGASMPIHLSPSGPSASARLSPPAFPNFAYNGVNAAMVAVMQRQQQQQQMLASSALLHRQSLCSPPTLTTSLPIRHDSRNIQHSPSTVAERSPDSTVSTSKNNATALGVHITDSSISSTKSLYHMSNKDEHSSDVPLNLSKH